jgi:hypothetical protein
MYIYFVYLPRLHFSLPLSLIGLFFFSFHHLQTTHFYAYPLVENILFYFLDASVRIMPSNSKFDPAKFQLFLKEV